MKRVSGSVGVRVRPSGMSPSHATGLLYGGGDGRSRKLGMGSFGGSRIRAIFPQRRTTLDGEISNAEVRLGLEGTARL